MRSKASRFGFLLAGWILLVWIAPVAAQNPTRTVITLDGVFADWESVYANPFQTALDGDGSSVPCPYSSDRDCFVPSSTTDIGRFAITWDPVPQLPTDPRRLHVYMERFEPTNNNRSYVLTLDVNNNDLFDANDVVVELVYKGNQRQVAMKRYRYVPGLPGGDPVVDAQGYADGYTLPGTAGAEITVPANPPICTTCGSVDGRSFEFSIPWATLGLNMDAPMGYHVSSGVQVTLDKDDNLAGSGGTKGSTVYRRHRTVPDHLGSALVSTGVKYLHDIQNTGNVPDRIRLRTISSLGFATRLYQDPEGDGLYTDLDLLASDTRGDGSYGDNNDVVTPLGDTDGDTWPDTGLLAPGAVFHVILVLDVPKSANRQIDRTDLRTTSTAYAPATEAARDTTAVGQLTIAPPISKNVEPGRTFYLGHTLTSHLATSDTFEVYFTSSAGWTYTVYSDPNGDGDPSDGVPLFDTNGNGIPDIIITSEGSASIVAVGTAPPGAPFGMVETLTVLSDGNLTGSIHASVTDRVTVQDTLLLQPNYTIANGGGKAVAAGRPVYYRHKVIFSGSEADSFSLTALSSNGWPVTFVTDPNGDGSPADGAVIPEPANSGPVAPEGGVFNFLARIDVPAGTPVDTVESTQVFAFSDRVPGLFRTATDQSTVSIVQVYSDPLYAQAQSIFPVCSTVHALANGLLPSTSGRYRFVWTDAQTPPAIVKVTPFATDRSGMGYDAYTVGPGEPSGSWQVAVQQLNGSWTDVDTTPFRLQLAGRLDPFWVEQTSYTQVSEYLTVGGTYQNTSDSDLKQVVVRYLVLAPGGQQYLSADGLFEPWSAGRYSRVSDPFTVFPGDSSEQVVTFADVTFPVAGTYSVTAFWDNTCGAEVASQTVYFQVTVDQDGDGLTDLDEVNRGTDPNDRDTDDDGLSDGEEVLSLLTDPLSCDSDADGLPDGLELGRTAPLDPGTDPGAGCFVPDGDPGTTTDPRDRDSDDGGVADGEEDTDRDGAVGPGEKDPLAGWDDPCASKAPLEVTGLRLYFQGDADIKLSWSNTAGTDPCAYYEVLVSTAPRPDSFSQFAVAASGLGATAWTDAGTLRDGNLRAYLVRAVSVLAGEGPLGAYGQ